MAHTYKIAPEVLAALDLPAIVAAWRKLHAPIRDLWYSCERAFHAAIKGHNTWAGPFEFVRAVEGDAVACFLPSGRPIVYPEARMSKSADREGLVYLGTKGREHLYGGKLVENAIQGLCRDLMSDALLRVEAAGLNPVLHVHDEIVCDVPETHGQAVYDVLHECMTPLPAWATGFPMAADGWVGRRYRK
jgi:DNA polymerase